MKSIATETTAVDDIDMISAMIPLYGSNYVAGDDVSYFPWLKSFDPGVDDTDSTVPVWSAALPLASFRVEVEHVNMNANAVVNQARTA